MYGEGGICESRIIRELVKTYVSYLTRLSPLFKKIQFEWTVDENSEILTLEWFQLIPW